MFPSCLGSHAGRNRAVKDKPYNSEKQEIKDGKHDKEADEKQRIGASEPKMLRHRNDEEEEVKSLPSHKTAVAAAAAAATTQSSSLSQLSGRNRGFRSFLNFNFLVSGKSS